MHGNPLLSLQGREPVTPFCDSVSRQSRGSGHLSAPGEGGLSGTWRERVDTGSCTPWVDSSHLGAPADRAFPFHLTQWDGHAHACAGGTPLLHGAPVWLGGLSHVTLPSVSRSRGDRCQNVWVRRKLSRLLPDTTAADGFTSSGKENPPGVDDGFTQDPKRNGMSPQTATTTQVAQEGT